MPATPAVASVVRARAREARRGGGSETCDGTTATSATTARIHARMKQYTRSAATTFSHPPKTRNRLGLARLELSYNRIGPATVEAMCAALRQDVELRALGMRACLVSDADAARLGKAMREHPALELVALGQSRVAGARLGALRVDVVGVVDGKKPSPPAKKAGEPG